MNRFLTILLAVFSLTFFFQGFSQNDNITFDDIKNENISFDSFTAEPEKFFNNLYLLVNKDIDSADIYFMFSAKIIPTIIVKESIVTKESQDSITNFTYSNLQEKLIEFKLMDFYEEYKTKYFLMDEIMMTVADSNLWDEHLEIFEYLEWEDTLVQKIKKVTFSNSDSTLTYYDIIQNFEEDKKQNSINSVGQLLTSDVDVKFELKELLSSAKIFDKPVILYFTGWTCVNCRKMEQSVLIEPSISTILIEKFELIALYTDDRTELKENEKYFSDKLNKQINTLGAHNLHLQASIADVSAQPYFVILDKSGNIIGSADFVNNGNVQEFRQALEDALAKFNQ